MANLPVPSSNSAPPGPSKLHELLIDGFERGEDPGQLARRLAKGDKAKAKAYRAQIRKLLRTNDVFQRAIVERARTNMVEGLPRATRGLVRMAGRRPDAAKLLLEATGVHNTKVQHQHSGEITIKMDIPRPKFVDAEAVEDADVVDLPAEPRP